MPKFYQNEEMTYIPDPAVEENPFIGMAQRRIELPRFAEIRDQLPIPVWQGHQNVLDC